MFFSGVACWSSVKVSPDCASTFSKRMEAGSGACVKPWADVITRTMTPIDGSTIVRVHRLPIFDRSIRQLCHSTQSAQSCREGADGVVHCTFVQQPTQYNPAHASIREGRPCNHLCRSCSLPLVARPRPDSVGCSGSSQPLLEPHVGAPAEAAHDRQSSPYDGAPGR